MHMSDCRNRTRLKRHHGLPPVTPNACVREAVLSLTFGHLWNEAVVVVQPLLAAVMLGVWCVSVVYMGLCVCLVYMGLCVCLVFAYGPRIRA